ncbi:PLP-dependent aminotransferase family protein [Streptomyces sp. NPDC127108]|uniref:MocR-like pyridoxine biosynthesis transcription factor PdxR n=1 Tax=Streptomyces sp. NPDC127108 TaxID=3345361 RepID=UPI00363C62BC
MSVCLPLDIDRSASAALSEQIRSRIIQLIRDGMLQPDTRLPSSRRLALDLTVSRSVVVEAYQQLTAEGWLVSRDRSGTRVSEAVEQESLSTAKRTSAERPAQNHWNLVPGSADVRSFPRGEWTTCLTTVLRHISDVDLDYPPLSGVLSVRQTLAGYLGRVRSVRATAQQVMVTTGFAQGLNVVCRMLQRRGVHGLALEDPGHPGMRQFLDNVDMCTVAIPVDDQGISVEALERSGVRAVLVTPAHQFPTGVVLSPGRRQALVEWARRVDGLIVEDDYDGEFWYDEAARPLSLQHLAPDHVVYGGTASKTLAPGLRLGWLVAPEGVVSDLQQARELFDLGSGTVEQLAYAEFIETGRCDKHLRRVRETYRRRFGMVRDYLVENGDPELELTGAAAGLHAHLGFPPNLDEAEFVHRARLNRIELRGASHFRLDRDDAAPGIVVGYAMQSDAWLAEALQVLRELAVKLARSPVPQL